MYMDLNGTLILQILMQIWMLLELLTKHNTRTKSLAYALTADLISQSRELYRPDEAEKNHNFTDHANLRTDKCGLANLVQASADISIILRLFGSL